MLLLPFLSLPSAFSQQFIETKINVGTVKKPDNRAALIYLPADYSTSKRYPLVVFSHGIGEAGNNVKKLYNQGLPKVLRQGYRPPFSFIMVAVQHNSFSVKPEWLPNILDECGERWKVDKRRIYLTGISAGGLSAYGSQLNITEAFAEKFAAIVVNSGVTHNLKRENLNWWKRTKTPLWAIVGAADKSYVNRNKQLVKEINKQVAGAAKLTIRQGVGHGGWTDVYNGKVKLDGKNMWEWLYQFKRADDDPQEKDEEETGSKYVKVNIYDGTDPYRNAGWHNWDVSRNNGRDFKTETLNYSNGTASRIQAELSNSYRVVDNSANYGSGIAPAAVLRHASYNIKERTLRLTGLSPSKKYTIELFGSRKNNPGEATIYKISNAARTVKTYRNYSQRAVFENVAPDNNNRIIIRIESVKTYNYINGFAITEISDEED